MTPTPRSSPLGACGSSRSADRPPEGFARTWPTALGYWPLTGMTSSSRPPPLSWTGWTSPLPAPRRSRSGPVRVSATLASWPGCVAWGVGPTPSTLTACAPAPGRPRLGRRRRGRTRLVVTLHNLTVGGRLTTLVGERLERLIASRADLVLAVSPDLAERARGLGAARVELAVIPAPVPHPSSEPTSSGPTAPEDVWPQEGARILTVARLAPQKGLSLLLDVAAALSLEAEAGRLPAFTWALAGDGPCREEAAERIAAEHLPVTLLGRRTDVPSLMEAADAVVQTSLWEGQPLTIQEALRAGAAIVATDVGGTAVTARGGAVLVVPEAQAIAGALTTLLTDPEAGSRARLSAREAAGLLPGPEDLAAQLRQAVLAQD